MSPKCGASRLFNQEAYCSGTAGKFFIEGNFLLPVNCGSHSDYQNFVVENPRKYYPNPDAISRDTWDIIDRFGNLDLYYTDEMMMSKYSKYGSAPNRNTSATL